MPSAEKTELIKHQEFYLEDIHEGLIVLDRALKLVARTNENHSSIGTDAVEVPISWNQAVNVVFYIASAIAREIEHLESVKPGLSPDAAKQLARYSERLRQRNRKVFKLESEYDLNRRYALRDYRVYNSS